MAGKKAVRQGAYRENWSWRRLTGWKAEAKKNITIRKSTEDKVLKTIKVLPIKKRVELEKDEKRRKG